MSCQRVIKHKNKLGDRMIGYRKITRILSVWRVNGDLWEGLTLEVQDSWTSRYTAHVHSQV